MSAAPCRYPWCQTNHETSPDLAHVCDLGAFDGPGQASAVMFQSEHRGRLGEPFVRITYRTEGRPVVLEISPQAAADFGDVLNGLSIRGYRDMAAAFAGLGRLQITMPGLLPGDLNGPSAGPGGAE
ncbi:hypothetical protein ACWDUI_24270 [Streptosporangium sandarakinum]